MNFLIMNGENGNHNKMETKILPSSCFVVRDTSYLYLRISFLVIHIIKFVERSVISDCGSCKRLCGGISNFLTELAQIVLLPIALYGNIHMYIQLCHPFLCKVYRRKLKLCIALRCQHVWLVILKLKLSITIKSVKAVCKFTNLYRV